MKKNVLLDLSQEFAVEVIAVARILKDKGEKGFADQIKRSGTSISANIAEGNHPQSRADMISKFEIALKEANETGYWLELLYKTNYITESEYKALDSACTSIRVMLISSINTAKERQ